MLPHSSPSVLVYFSGEAPVLTVEIRLCVLMTVAVQTQGDGFHARLHTDPLSSNFNALATVPQMGAMGELACTAVCAQEEAQVQ